MTTPELIESFYEQHKDEFPDINLSEMKLVVSSPFEMFKETMQSGEFEEVRLQYLFVARVSQARVIKHLRSVYKNKKENKISDKAFKKYEKLLLGYIKKYPEKFKKYKQTIKEIIGNE